MIRKESPYCRINMGNKKQAQNGQQLPSQKFHVDKDASRAMCSHVDKDA